MEFWEEEEPETLGEENSAAEEIEAEATEAAEETTTEEAGGSLAEDAIKMYLNDVQKTRLLSAEDERRLGTLVAQGDAAARERMIQSNLRLVIKIAKRYQNRGLPLLDLIEEGNIGLIKAVDRFKVKKGCRFSTYATWWIRQSIERALVNQSRTIRLPVHVDDDVTRMVKISRELRSRLKREPLVVEVAEAMGVTPGQVEHLMGVARKTYSIDHPMGENSDYSLADTIEDSSSVNPATLAEDLQEFEKVDEWLQSLSESERKILNLRYGLDDRETQTLDTIGKQFGVTRERIRQIQNQGLEKIRRLMEADAAVGLEELAAAAEKEDLSEKDEELPAEG